MKYESIQEEKGLFTFYKEQQAEEEEIRRILKKRRKGKNKKSKKNMLKLETEPNHCSSIKQLQMSEESQSPQNNKCDLFLKNVISKNSYKLSTQNKSQQLIRLRTDPFSIEKQRQKVSNLFIQSKLQCGQTQKLTKIIVYKQKLKNDFIENQLKKANDKIDSLHTRIKELQLKSKSEKKVEKFEQQISQPMSINLSPIKQNKYESKSFLDKLKFLEIKSNSNLISHRESICQGDGEKTDLHKQNKKYFHKLISNFYQHSDAKNQTGYKIIKDTLRFPNISKQKKTIRVKTQEQSPIQSKKLMTPVKNFSSKQKQLKIKSMQENTPVIFKLRAAKQLREPNYRYEPSKLNFIDMSKDYSRELVDSEQRKINKKLIKTRLGIQI